MRKMQDQFLVGVTGVILNEKKEVLLFHHTYRQNEWGLPGGYIKAAEHPKEGLEREIAEESGYIVSIDERYKIRTDRESARLDVQYVLRRPYIWSCDEYGCQRRSSARACADLLCAFRRSHSAA